MALCWHGRRKSRGMHGRGRWGRGVACEKHTRGSQPCSSNPVSARPVLTSHARGAQLFAVVPLSSLGVGPEVTNNMCKWPTPPSRPPMRRAVQFVRYSSSPRAVQYGCLTSPPPLPACPCILRCTDSPHNCVGGSETYCLPGPAEAAVMFADPSKMQNIEGVPAPAHFY